MTNFVVSVPGTFKEPLGAEARARLLTGLQGADPEEVGSVPSDLDVLSVDEGTSTFILRLEVEAEDSRAAQREALSIASRALAQAGYTEESAPVGNAVITAIDVE
ncbi:hypothetical protein [Streptomyces sp. H27-D2]|uniref:hypothetical protein n=1 Tax=Streptomyces sp. H27-D2 TaxID=3046304 RepID=UPI002DBC3791|nr:hypothetical protein [Streptomyces sp. H27-D2]MEC4018738.1 hypothetical protein [Streptomyces sp. H27-D2]